MLEIGKLYCCEEYYLLLFPDKEDAAYARGPWIWRDSPSIYLAIAYWSKRLYKPVGYAEKNIPLLVLNREEEYIEVLAGDRKGWFSNEALLNLKEIG